MTPALPVGKLPAGHLQTLLARYAPLDDRVVVGPRVGEDAAVLDLGARYLVVTTDPITFATDQMGWYALAVNANDLAVRGATPRWFLATVLLPEARTTAEQVEALFVEIGEACRALGVSLVGGHTEVTAGLPRPIVVGVMLGEVDKERLVITAGAAIGDSVLLSKGVPLEGAAIIARERGAEALRRGVAKDVVDRAGRFLREPGIGVLAEARLACDTARVHSMHDPTEGGLATACWEVAQAAGVGLRIERAQIPVLPEGAALCAAFGLDALGTIASGALLLTLAPADADGVLAAWRGAGIDGAVIGRVTPAADAVVLVTDGHESAMPTFATDEITRLFKG